jgi:hypothetical protein
MLTGTPEASGNCIGLASVSLPRETQTHRWREMDSKLCNRLYKIASDDAQPLRRYIVDAMREVGSEAILPTLEAILFDLEQSAIIRPASSDLLASLEEKSRAEFLRSVAVSIGDIKSRAAAQVVGVLGTPEEARRGPGPAPDALYSCFISYSSKDQVFADKLHADLQDAGVRCWFAPHDLPIGAKTWDAIDEAIGLRDKLLVILSEASIRSDWVEDEVNKAYAKERDRNTVV